MRRLLIIALLLITIKSIAQVKQDRRGLTDTARINVYHTDNDQNKWPPLVYVNSSLTYRSVPYMNPNDISTMNISKGKDIANKTDGVINISLKKPDAHFISISELTQKCIPGFDAKKQPVVYVIDDKFIDDAVDVAFETSYIKGVEVLDYSKDIHHTGPLSNLIVLKIYTQSSDVYIKGAASQVSIER
jgi:hypothetical protein